MNPSDMQLRYEELQAGHAIGDLSMEEECELATLCQQLGVSPDASLDLLAAAVHADALEHSAETLPPHLAARLHQWADETSGEPSVKTAGDNIIRPEPSVWRRLAVHPFAGWAAAVVVLMVSLRANREPQTQTQTQTLAPVQSERAQAQSEQGLRATATDLIERPFEGLGSFKQAEGSVIWSDSLQQGFLLLSGIPANDPSQKQYQLWIVDPERDPDAPVDGGVFDIPRDASRAVIPITAKLPLSNPRAFVITVEQPGGVVKSRQEQVVALAKS